MPNKCIQMNLLHRGTSRAPITLQSLMHLLCWKEGSAAISISRLGNGNTGRLSILLKVTQKVCSRAEECSQNCQVSAQRGDHNSTCEQRVTLGEAFTPWACPLSQSLAWDTLPKIPQPVPTPFPSSSLLSHSLLQKAVGVFWEHREEQSKGDTLGLACLPLSGIATRSTEGAEPVLWEGKSHGAAAWRLDLQLLCLHLDPAQMHGSHHCRIGSSPVKVSSWNKLLESLVLVPSELEQAKICDVAAGALWF